MTENKQKLIALVSALQEENIIDYCYTFIGLKVYGAAKLPDSITAELRQMYDNYLVLCGYADKEELEQEQERHEQTAEEKKAGEYRCNIFRMIYDINSLAILNYINIIVSDIAKEDTGEGGAIEEKEVIAELLSEVGKIGNIALLRFIVNVVKSFKKKGWAKYHE